MTLVSFNVNCTRFVSFEPKDSGSRPVRPQIVSNDNSLRFVSASIEVGIGPWNEFGPNLIDSSDERRDIELGIEPPKEFEFK